MKNTRLRYALLAVGILIALTLIVVSFMLPKNDVNSIPTPNASDPQTANAKLSTEETAKPIPKTAKEMAESFPADPSWETINDIEHIFAVSDCGKMPCSTIQRDWDMKAEISTAKLQEKIDAAGWDIHVTGDCQSISSAEASRCAARTPDNAGVSIAVFVREGESTTLSLYIQNNDG